MMSTYLNPVYNESFPDPFVLKYRGEYWAYCTGFWHDGRCFGILHSRDLVCWRPLAGALAPLPGDFPCYWAPEVTYDNGRFYLYYSAGNEASMEIRVALAEHPAGPFADSGRRLTTETFAIDAHVFVDDDGARYLFYATDFLDRSHIGTGIVRDRLLDPLTPAGRPQPVTLPRYDWHVYDPQRAEKGGVRWHTIEGSFVLKRKRLYYHMFSGGNWQNITYGVSYAVAESLAVSDEWTQVADGEAVLPILRTLPGQVVGPGHNSVVRGPGNQQLFCVYHRWSHDGSARVLSIDPLDWAGERMLVLGPSVSPQPTPLPPSFADFFDEERAEGLGAGWTCEGGSWATRSGAALQESDAGQAAARCGITAPCYVVEVSLRALAEPGERGTYGVSLGDDLFFLLEPGRQRALARIRHDDRWEEQPFALPPGFAPGAYHLLRLEVDGDRVTIALDGNALRWTTTAPGPLGAPALRTIDMAAAFAGFTLTVGWQDLFERPDGSPARSGWQALAGDWVVRAQQLQVDAGQVEALIARGPPLDAYELVVNARLEGDMGCYGFFPALGPGQRSPLLAVERAAGGWVVRCHERAGQRSFSLPGDFDPAVYQQFRFRKQSGQLTIHWEAYPLGVIDLPPEATRIGLYARQARAAFEMVRVTEMRGDEAPQD